MSLSILYSFLLVSLPCSHAFLHNFGSSSSSSSSTPFRQPSTNLIEDSFAAVHLQAGEAGQYGQNVWSQGDANPYMHTQLNQPPLQEIRQHHQLPAGDYQLPPSLYDDTGSFGYPNMPLLDEGGSIHGYDPFHTAMTADMGMAMDGGHQLTQSYQLPPDYDSYVPDRSGMYSLHSSDGGSSSIHDGAGDSGNRVVGLFEEQEEEVPQQPQTARARLSRMRVEEEEQEEGRLQQQPSTARASKSGRGNEREQLAANRKWLRQQWKARKMSFSMPAQFLAQQVTEIKIMFPDRARPVGMTSNRWVDGAMGSNEDYLFDYHAWIDTYQDHITRLRRKYTKPGLAEGSAVVIGQILAHYKDTQTKQHATLGDPKLEERDVQYSHRVWNEFNRDRLQAALNAGEPLSMELVARLSWDYENLNNNNFEAVKYINKYLRCVMHMSVPQLAQLKALQGREKEEHQPQDARRKSGRARPS